MIFQKNIFAKANKWLANIAFLCIILIIIGYSIFWTFAQQYDHDENQFISSAALFVEGYYPYSDYAFFHMPYSILLNSFSVLWNGSLFLNVRFITTIFWLLSLVVLNLLILTFFKSSENNKAKWLGIIFSIGLLMDGSFSVMFGKALNHAAATFFSLLAFFLALRSLRIERNNNVFAFLGGFALSVSFGVRLNYAILLIPLTGIFLFNRKFRMMCLFLFGGLVGSAPLIITLFSYYHQFVFDNFGYVKLNTEYRELENFSIGMTLESKTLLFFNYLKSNLFAAYLYIILVFNCIVIARSWTTKHQLSQDFVTFTISTLLMLVTSFLPTPTWLQYFFSPIPFLLLSAVAFFIQSSEGTKKVTIVLFLLSIGSTIPNNVNSVKINFDRENWDSTKIKQQAEKISNLKVNGPVLTLMPLLPLEANLKIYPEFAVSPFVWRTSTLVLKNTRDINNIISPSELGYVLRSNPPGMIITGVENSSFLFLENDEIIHAERPLIDYAQLYDYSQDDASGYFKKNTIWLKP